MKLTARTSHERLDIFLARELKDYSRSYFQHLIKIGYVVVNHKQVLPSYQLKMNDEITISLQKAERKEISEETIPLEILYEDSDVLVINKQAGLVVHPACGHPSGTLVNAIAGHAKKKFAPLLVHRLDKNTTGVMVVAKNERAKVSLVKQFQQRTITKKYWVMVQGEIKESRGRIEAPLGRSPQDRKKMIVGPAAKKWGITEFKVLKRKKEYTLVEAKLVTGRTHQIRSHFMYIGYPVLGDEMYGGPASMKGYIFNRQMLHAYALAFTHPSTGKRIEFITPLPDDMNRIWDSL